MAPNQPDFKDTVTTQWFQLPATEKLTLIGDAHQLKLWLAQTLIDTGCVDDAPVGKVMASEPVHQAFNMLHGI